MDAKDDIKQRLSVEDVVGDYLELKRAGRNMKALSPWTNERTPSFMVSPEKQIWHDFSANRGGDIFSFVMEMEGVDFRGALEILARKAGVDLDQYARGSGRTGQLKKRLFEAHELATKYYHVSLSKNKTALEYVLKTRGFKKDIVQQFQLGYAPTTGSALVAFLKKRKFTDDELRRGGLAVNRRGIPSDMFRGRLMVPLADGQGRVIGFTARLLRDGGGPKYINTPQTLLYDKGRHVFGLHLAKPAIRETNFAVIVEGQLDVIASHQAGIANVVAAAGTALTTDHLKQLNRLTEDIRLAFDTDEAGVAATERAIALAQETGVTLSIIDIPEGKDPDELVKQDPKLWQKAIDNARYVVDWLFDHHAKRLDIKTAKGKTAFTDHILTVLARINDPVEQEHYLKQLAETVDVSVDSVKQKFDSLKQPAPKKRYKNVTAKRLAPDKQAYIDQLLGLLITRTDTREHTTELKSEHFINDEQRAVFEFINAHPETVVGDEIPPQLHGVEDYVKILVFKTEELYGDWSESDIMIETIGFVRRLSKDFQQLKQKQISEQIKQAEAAGDKQKVEQLLKEFKQV